VNSLIGFARIVYSFSNRFGQALALEKVMQKPIERCSARVYAIAANNAEAPRPSSLWTLSA